MSQSRTSLPFFFFFFFFKKRPLLIHLSNPSFQERCAVSWFKRPATLLRVGKGSGGRTHTLCMTHRISRVCSPVQAHHRPEPEQALELENTPPF